MDPRAGYSPDTGAVPRCFEEWRVGLDHQSFQVADRDELN